MSIFVIKKFKENTETSYAIFREADLVTEESFVNVSDATPIASQLSFSDAIFYKKRYETLCYG